MAIERHYTVIPVAASILISFLLHGLDYLPVALLFSILSTSLILVYSKKTPVMFLLIAVIIAAAALLWQQYTAVILQTTGVSSALTLLLTRGNDGRSKKLSAKIETKRDVLQIMIGVIVIILAFSSDRLVVFMLVFLGFTLAYIAGQYDSNSLGFLREMERYGVVFGSGALYLAAGTLLLLGFVHSQISWCSLWQRCL